MWLTATRDDNHVIDDSMTQGNDLHLVTRGNTTGTVKAAGDLVTTRGKADKRRDKEQ